MFSAVSSRVLSTWDTANGASLSATRVKVTVAALVPVPDDRLPSETEMRKLAEPDWFRAGSKTRLPRLATGTDWFAASGAPESLRVPREGSVSKV